MSSVASTTSSTAASTSSNTNSDGSPILGKDDFLKLLMTQMSNQDPLNPTDDTQFVSQLAQFSTVEQMSNMNDTLSSLLTAQASANQISDVSLVGKSVEVSGNTVTLASLGSTATIGGTVSGAGVVTATITDSTGKVVDTFQSPATAAGNWSATWNGCDSTGSPVAAGTYTIALTAQTTSGTALTASPYTTGVVSGISYANGAAQLVVNGQSVAMSSIVEIDQTPATSTSGSTP